VYKTSRKWPKMPKTLKNAVFDHFGLIRPSFLAKMSHFDRFRLTGSFGRKSVKTAKNGLCRYHFFAGLLIFRPF